MELPIVWGVFKCYGKQIVGILFWSNVLSPKVLCTEDELKFEVIILIFSC